MISAFASATQPPDERMKAFIESPRFESAWDKPPTLSPQFGGVFGTEELPRLVDCHDEKTDPCAWRARAQMSATYEPGLGITTRNSASMAPNLRDRVLGALHGLYSISNSTVFRIEIIAKPVAEKYFLGQTAVSWVTSSRRDICRE